MFLPIYFFYILDIISKNYRGLKYGRVKKTFTITR